MNLQFQQDAVLIPPETAWFGFYAENNFSAVLAPQEVSTSDPSKISIEIEQTYTFIHLSEPFLTLEVSSNSTRLLVGSWLFCVQYLPCLVSFQCMLGGN